MSTIFLTAAPAEAAAASAGMGWGSMIIWLAVMIGIMYFLMIRPQKNEQKRVSAMLNDMAVGDSVVTTSGFYGVILDITDDDVIVEFGNNKNCRIPMRKSAIAQVEKAGDAYSETASAQPEKKSLLGGLGSFGFGKKKSADTSDAEEKK